MAVDLPDVAVEFRDPLHVDHDLRPKCPVAQPNDQVSATGQRPGFGAVPPEESDSVGEAGRTLVGESSHRRG